ncbi:triokinase/FMN cyclase isoform X1 [Heptranchias perlo]|uniref:triokinase/FMN cyclase isoform X1 n=1 Tax=Heptranchias perlo TaxID=212740 RepID=UPI003559ECFC
MMHHSKKLINSVDRCVDDALEGLVTCNVGMQLLQGHRIVIRSDLKNIKGKVALLSGGGSGHEPAHAGYVGAGMLSGAIAGDVFTSPPPGSISAAIRTMDRAGAAGVLLIVKNYTGDRLNFGLALEETKIEGISVAMVIVADDCAFTTHKKAGRRGLCGTVLIHKLAGAMSEMGKSLDEIVARLKTTLSKLGTMGICLSPCSVPGAGPTFHLEMDELELGLGIHGEAGIKRIKMISADEVIQKIIDHMTDPSNESHLSVQAGDHIVLIVNNLGGLSCLELNIVARSAVKYLESKQVIIDRAYIGSFMTSLEMGGTSLTLMHVDREELKLLDSRTSAPGWANVSKHSLARKCRALDVPYLEPDNTDIPPGSGPFVDKARSVLDMISTTLLQMEEELNELDREAGDGDCGITHVRAAQAIKNLLMSNAVPGNGHQLLLCLGRVVRDHMGGTSGALYSISLTAAAQNLKDNNNPSAWAAALDAGIEALKRYGGAEPGDRTMLDSLCAAADELRKMTDENGNELQVLAEAVRKAEAAAEATKDMIAKAGRASYISSAQLTRPDPGAVACAAILKAILTALEQPEPAAEQPEPTAEQPEPAAEQPEPAAEQPEPAAEQPEPAAEQPEPAAEQPEPAAEQPEPAAEQPEPAAEQPELAAEQPELAAEQPEPAAEQPEPAAEQPEPAAEQPEPAAEQPEPAAEQPEPAAEQPEPAAEQPEPAAEQPEPAAEQPEPAPEQPEPAPEQPEPAPEQPEPAPEQPEPAPEQSEPAPEQPEPAPEQPEPAAEQPEPAPEQPEPAPEQPEPAPEQPEPAAEQPEPAPEQPEPTAEQQE